MPATPTVSVVVCTRDRPEELERCLRALSALTPPADEILVVNNSPDDERARAIALAHGAIPIHEPRPGLSRARNTGAARASKDVIAYIDDDAVAEPGWVGGFRDALSDGSLSAATGRTVELTGLAHPSNDLGDRPWRMDRTAAHWFERANFGGLGIGANMAFRREVISGGLRFCEWIGAGTPIAGGEEHYAYFELLRDGHRIAYVPEAVVRHVDRRDGEGDRDREKRMLEASAAYGVALLVQEPGFRLATLRYLAGSVAGRRREWRPPAAQAAPSSTRSSLLVAGCRAPWRYLRSRLVQRYSSAGRGIQ